MDWCILPKQHYSHGSLKTDGSLWYIFPSTNVSLDWLNVTGGEERMRRELHWSTSTGTLFFKSLPAVLTAAQFSNSDGLSKQFLESADCLSIYRAPPGTGFTPGREDGVYENARWASPLLGCAFTCQLLKGELSNPIKMQNIDIHSRESGSRGKH